jgi:uncharacterized membrane protein
MKPKEFLSRLEHDEIVRAIQSAEKKSSGQIRVFVTRKEPSDVIAAAHSEFDHLGMRKTKERNGVLIFVAPHVHQFAVVGDQAVHQQCGDKFWREVALEMSAFFKQGNFTQGIVHGINKAGDLLARHFPPHEGDQNELPDEIAGD